MFSNELLYFAPCLSRIRRDISVEDDVIVSAPKKAFNWNKLMIQIHHKLQLILQLLANTCFCVAAAKVLRPGEAPDGDDDVAKACMRGIGHGSTWTGGRFGEKVVMGRIGSRGGVWDGTLEGCCAGGDELMFRTTDDRNKGWLEVPSPENKRGHCQICWPCQQHVVNVAQLEDRLLSAPDINSLQKRGAAIAQWIRLHLPSCHPGFESQAQHLSFYQFKFELCHVEKDKNKQKEAGIGPFLTVSRTIILF